MNSINLRQSGVSLIEVIVAMAIITSMLVAVGFSVTSYVDARTQLLDNTKSVYLAEEGYEMLRVIRDDDWSTINGLVNGTTYYFDVTDTTLAITATPEIIDTDFTRSFVLSRAFRDSNDDIVDSSDPSAVVDSGTRVIDVSVAGPTGTSTLKALIANLYAI